MQEFDTRLSQIAFANNWRGVREAFLRFVSADRTGVVQLGGGATWDPATKVLFLPDTTEPATPVGGVYVWSEAGELKAKDTSGTVATVT